MVSCAFARNRRPLIHRKWEDNLITARLAVKRLEMNFGGITLTENSELKGEEGKVKETDLAANPGPETDAHEFSSADGIVASPPDYPRGGQWSAVGPLTNRH
jgi:hypothetical protein